MKRLFAALLSVLIMTFGPQRVHAKAYFMRADQMIQVSEAIAIVNITTVAKVEKKGLARTYSKEGDVTLERSLKGSLPKQFKIYGQEDFICAQCQFDPGKYLLFLNRDNGFWIGANWHLSMRPIKNGKIDWYPANGNLGTLVPVSLDDVVAQVQKTLPDQAKVGSLPAPLKTLAGAEVLEDEIVGESPGKSKTQLAFENARKNCLDDRTNLELLSKYGTSAGRIYGSILLNAKDPDAAKANLQQLATCNATMQYKSGCRLTTVGMWAVASALYSNGKYMNLALEKGGKKSN